MTSQQLDEEKIFHVARTMDDPAIRSEYLDQVCAGGTMLRDRIESLLKLHDQDTGFLKSVNATPATTDLRLPIEKPGTVIGRYRLMEQIGEGGMGTVFVAEQERPIRRKVALKVIKPGMDSKAVIARFEAERQALAMMDHPNIAKVLDAGTTESGLPFFAMELVRGISLTDYCDKNKLSIRERLGLFTQVCQAIQHAHQKGIIHRDIKPSNVLVTLHDGKPVPKVIDFGVAKAVNARLTDKTIYTEHLQIVGTLLYMSPEQAELSGLDVDTRSDIYSLGVLLYELLTGTTPFQQSDLEKAGFDEKRRIIREDEPPRASIRISSLGDTATTIAAHRQTDPNKLNQLLRGDLDWIVLRALEKDRTRRYETATDLAKDVERFLSDDAVVARPPSTSYRLSKFSRRNRTGILVASVIFATLLAATVFSIYQANKQRRIANDLAKANAAIAVKETEARTENQKHKALLKTNQDLFFERAFVDVLSVEDSSEAFNDAVQAGVSADRIAALGAWKLIFDGKSEQAAMELEPIVERDPNNIMAWALLLNAYQMHRAEDSKHERAVKHIKSLSPSDDYETLFAGFTKSLYSGSNQKMTEALNESRAVLNRHPAWISARILNALDLGRYALVTGDWKFSEEAIELIRPLKNLIGDSALFGVQELYLEIGIIQSKGRMGLDAAEAERRGAGMVAGLLEKYPDLAFIHWASINFRLLTGQLDLAEKDFAFAKLHETNWRHDGLLQVLRALRGERVDDVFPPFLLELNSPEPTMSYVEWLSGERSQVDVESEWTKMLADQNSKDANKSQDDNNPYPPWIALQLRAYLGEGIESLEQESRDSGISVARKLDFVRYCVGSRLLALEQYDDAIPLFEKVAESVDEPVMFLGSRLVLMRLKEDPNWYKTAKMRK